MDGPAHVQCVLVLGFYVMATCFTQLHAGRILLLPLHSNSHLLHSTALGEELLKRGHQVDMVLSPKYPPLQRLSDSAISILHYEERIEETIIGDDADGEFMRMIVEEDIEEVSHVRLFQELGMPYCHNLLGDQELFKKLKTTDYDLAVVDGFSLVRCLYALVYRLGVPFVSLVTTYDPWLYRVPALPSFIPFAMATDYSERMTFFERLRNTYLQLDWHVAPRMKVMQDSLVEMYVPEKPLKSLNDIFRDSALIMLNSDPTLDYPRPSMPHVVNNGGLTAAPAKPLPSDLGEFVDGAEEGVILVSFGSILPCMPPDYTERFLAAFTPLRQRVVMRHCVNRQPDHPPDNVLLRDWLPQNDLLGHSNVKLFITHGGNNGQFEALYHGVPMITLPIYAEQRHNARRVEYKGYGLRLKINTFSPDQLTAAINEVLSNPKYTNNIQKASKIFRSTPMSPQEVAIYWIEHVLEFGSSHLHSHALDMPWYQYLMLDVIAFIFFITVASGFLLFKLILFCARCCERKKNIKTD